MSDIKNNKTNEWTEQTKRGQRTEKIQALKCQSFTLSLNRALEYVKTGFHIVVIDGSVDDCRRSHHNNCVSIYV